MNQEKFLKNFFLIKFSLQNCNNILKTKKYNKLGRAKMRQCPSILPQLWVQMSTTCSALSLNAFSQLSRLIQYSGYEPSNKVNKTLTVINSFMMVAVRVVLILLYAFHMPEIKTLPGKITWQQIPIASVGNCVQE